MRKSHLTVGERAEPESGSDLEMVRLCAEAMALDHSVEYRHGYVGNPRVVVLYDPETRKRHNPTNSAWKSWPEYDPLHDDAQAMALVKKFHLRPRYNNLAGAWVVSEPPRNDSGIFEQAWSADLNRAIVEAVAKMQAGHPVKHDHGSSGNGQKV